MSQPLRCCICNEPAAPGKVIGGRAYCDRHFAVVNRAHPSFWRSAFVQVVAMGVLAAMVAFVARDVDVQDRGLRMLIGLALAIIPTGLWLWYFYTQDSLEPEPKQNIAAVFFVALLLADVVAARLVNDVFQYAQWTGVNRQTSLLASILILGFTYQAIVYVALRATVYPTSEFDERMDGIVYGTTAGLGVATLLNLHLIVDNQGVLIWTGVINTVTTALAHACFGGLLGFFMAEAKFAHKPVWWVPLGLCFSAVLNGLFLWLIDEVAATGLTVNPWYSLLLGVTVALATFIVLVWLMRRANRLMIEATR